MRRFIRKIGHIKLVILITISAIIASELLIYLISKLFSIPYLIPGSVILAFLIPLILAPIISWHLVKLLLKIDTLEMQMRYLANYDSMTKLLSRQAFFDRSLQLHETCISQKKSYIAAIVDIDNFKHINDTYGHAIGDKILENLGELFKNTFTNSEIIGRIGGEEFTLVMYHSPKNQQKIIDNFREKVSKEKIMVNSHAIHYTISIGLFNNLTPKDLTFEKALSNADYALYHAKVTGKNKMVIFTHSLLSENISKQSSYLRNRIDQTHNGDKKE